MEKTFRTTVQNFFDGENDLLCSTKDFTKFTFISENWTGTLGWSRKELDQKDFKELIHPEDLEKTLSLMEVAKTKTRIYDFGNRLVTLKKEIKFLEWRIYFDMDENIFFCVGHDVTTLKQKDHLFELSQKHGILGTWQYHLNSGILSRSEEYSRMYELEISEELTYAKHASFYDAENWARANAVFDECVLSGTPWDIELQITTPSGAVKWTQSWGYPVYLGTEIVGVEGIILDLTPRKNQEFILQQTVEELGKLHLSLNQHCLVARLNRFGYFLDINKVFEKSSGHALPEFLGKSFSDFLREPEARLNFLEVLALLGKGGKWRGELRLQSKSGSSVWVDMSMTPIMDQSQTRLSEIVCIAYDITEKKLNDERYKTVISGINAGIWDMPDLSQDLVYWSPRNFEILEYDPETVIPTKSLYLSLVHPDEVAMVIERSRLAFETELSYTIEHRILCGNGKYKWIHILSVILRDEQGSPYRILGSITDINQKKIIEFHLEEEKQKTIQQSKLATLGEMAAGLAHEVNNPLTIIFGYIRILEEEISEREVDYDLMQKHVGLIKKAAERAAKIVTNLKDFSRDGSKDPLVEIPASQLITMVLDLCNERFKTNGIRIDLEIQNDPVIYCRKIELSQVLLNLLFNSFDAVENDREKWVKLVVFQNSQHIELSITDSGTGLPTEIIEKMFTPFFTTKKVGKGTGIGLSISQRIVLNHGGEIFYDTSSEHTKFVIRLPFNEDL